MEERKQMAQTTLHTRLCDILGIEYPVILAGMGAYAGPTLAAAVSNAGGLGVIGATGVPEDKLAEWIRKTRNLTNKPFGVDLLIPSLPLGFDAESVVEFKLPAEQVDFVNNLMKEFGIPKPRKAVEIELSTKMYKKQVEICLEEQVPVFVSGLGNPDWMVSDAHAQGMKVIGLVGNVKNARRVAEAGVDIVVAGGHEGGGHVGRVGTLALVPQVVDAVHPTPVVAAGGIADGRGLAACLALGACGVLVGTAFLVSHEAHADAIEADLLSQWQIDHWKQKIVECTEEDTVVTRSYSGKTMRNLRNKWISAWEQPDAPPTLPMPLQLLLTLDAMEGAREAEIKDVILWPTGQIAGMIKELKSAKQIVHELVDGAVRVVQEVLPTEVIAKS